MANNTNYTSATPSAVAYTITGTPISAPSFLPARSAEYASAKSKALKTVEELVPFVNGELSAISSAFLTRKGEAESYADQKKTEAQSYADSLVVGLASESYADQKKSEAQAYADGLVVGLASETYVDTAKGEAQSYADGLVVGLASETFVNSAVAGLASESYVDSAVGAIDVGDSLLLSDVQNEIQTFFAQEQENIGNIISEAETSANQYTDQEIAVVNGRVDDLISNLDPAAIDSFTEVVTAFQEADGNLQTSITTITDAHAGRLSVNEGDIANLQQTVADLWAIVQPE